MDMDGSDMGAATDADTDTNKVSIDTDDKKIDIDIDKILMVMDIDMLRIWI